MKTQKIIFWASTGFIFLFEGLMPLSSLLFWPEQATIGTRPLGYPDYFAYSLIICKVLGTSTLMIPMVPKTIKEWAYAGLSFTLIFAVISHAVVDGDIGFLTLPLVIGVILSTSYISYHRLQKKR